MKRKKEIQTRRDLTMNSFVTMRGEKSGTISKKVLGRGWSKLATPIGSVVSITESPNFSSQGIDFLGIRMFFVLEHINVLYSCLGRGQHGVLLFKDGFQKLTPT
jgi:hypothetical protein